MTDPPQMIHVADSIRSEAQIEELRVSEPPVRETTRGAMAVGLLGVLLLEVGFTFAAIPLHWMTFDQVKEFFPIVTAPTIGLVGPVMGFYFSSQK